MDGSWRSQALSPVLPAAGFAILMNGLDGQVGEWLKPTDCKSVPPSEVRRFESFPVHQIEKVAKVESWARFVRSSSLIAADFENLANADCRQ